MSARPTFHVLLCRMDNGTVAKLHTHRVDNDTMTPIPLSSRALSIMQRASRITAPDIHGNASRQTEKRSR